MVTASRDELDASMLYAEYSRRPAEDDDEASNDVGARATAASSTFYSSSSSYSSSSRLCCQCNLPATKGKDLRCEVSSCRAIYHRKCVNAAVDEVTADVTATLTKEYCIFCPACAKREIQLARQRGEHESKLAMLQEQVLNHPRLTRVDCPGFRLTCKIEVVRSVNNDEGQQLKTFKDIMLDQAVHMTFDEKTAFLRTFMTRR